MIYMFVFYDNRMFRSEYQQRYCMFARNLRMYIAAFQTYLFTSSLLYSIYYKDFEYGTVFADEFHHMN